MRRRFEGDSRTYGMSAVNRVQYAIAEWRSRSGGRVKTKITPGRVPNHGQEFRRVIWGGYRRSTVNCAGAQLKSYPPGVATELEGVGAVVGPQLGRANWSGRANPISQHSNTAGSSGRGRRSCGAGAARMMPMRRRLVDVSARPAGPKGRLNPMPTVNLLIDSSAVSIQGE